MIDLEPMIDVRRHIVAVRVMARHTNPSLHVLRNSQGIEDSPSIRGDTALNADSPWRGCRRPGKTAFAGTARDGEQSLLRYVRVIHLTIGIAVKDPIGAGSRDM